MNRDDYSLTHSTPPDDILTELAAETRRRLPGRAGMQVSADEGRLLTMLTRLTRATFAVEVGVFTGYSAICIARGLAPGGRLLACDVSQEWTSLALPYWEKAGVAERIDLRLAPALETLQALPHDPIVDFAFVDADKTGYPLYYEELVPRLRPGGLMVFDNVFLGGRVVEGSSDRRGHTEVRQLNEAIPRDRRVEAVMLPLRDGVTVVQKRL